MSTNDKKPVIFIAFANETESEIPGDEPRYLEKLADEKRKLEDILSKAQAQGNCEKKSEAYTRVDDVLDVFQSPEYRDRIAIFHFGGHANGKELRFERAGGGNKNTNAGGLAEFFGYQKGLELVFLNGCSTRDQVQGLFDADVSAVIATDSDINDLLATRFAVRFYRGLTHGLPLQDAFDQATPDLETSKTNKTERPAGEDSSRAIGNTKSASHIKWQLHTKKGCESIKEWTLWKAANNHLFGLPKLEKRGLFPPNPYQKPDGFREEDAEFFFGRDKEIRELYDLVIEPDSAPLILFYGQAWVGKSSLLAAGLIPRIKYVHKILRCKLDSDSVLPTVFRGLFNANETVPIIDAWKALEEQREKPVTVIIDQFEEVFNRHSTTQKDEIDKFKDEISDFLKDLTSIFKDYSMRPQGKLILGIRSNRQPDLLDILRKHDLSSTKNEVYLGRLNEQGIVEAITGIEKLPSPPFKYNLTIDDDLPKLIAADLLKDPGSSVGPSLQMLLTEMWRLAKEQDQDNPRFTKQTYVDLYRDGAYLNQFFDKKLGELCKWRKEDNRSDIHKKGGKTQNGEQIVSSGLVLDLLFEHVTDSTKAQTLTHEQLQTKYDKHEVDVLELVKECKRIGLLVDPSRNQEIETGDSRLVHDSHAPLVRAMYDKSEKVGQRARKILESRSSDWDKEPYGDTLDAADLSTVKDGESGMRNRTPTEEILVAASKKEVNRQTFEKYLLFVLIVFWLVIMGNLQLDKLEALKDVAIANERTAEEKRNKDYAETRTAAARVISLAESHSDPLISALLLANLEDLDLPDDEEPAHGVRVALNTVQKPIPLDIMQDHTGSLTSVDCNKTFSQVITTSADETAKIWGLNSPNSDRPDYVKSFKLPDAPNGGTFDQFGEKFITWSSSIVQQWENPHPLSQINEPLTPKQVGCHASPIVSAEFRPKDAKHLLTATTDGTIQVWNANQLGENDDSRLADCPELPKNTFYSKLVETRKDALTLAKEDGITLRRASYSPDGKYVVAIMSDGKFLIWRVDNDKYDLVHTEVYHNGKQLSMAKFSPKSAYLVTVVNKPGEEAAYLWSLREGSENSELSFEIAGPTELVYQNKEIENKEALDHSISDVQFDRKNNRILTVSRDGEANFWDFTVQEGHIELSSEVALIGHEDGISSAEFSGSGKYIVTGSTDGTVRVWNIALMEEESNELRKSLELVGHAKDVTDVIFCPNDENIVSISNDHQVRFWNRKGTEEPYPLTEKNGSALDAQFSPDGNYIAVAFSDDPAEIWEETSPGKFNPMGSLGTKPVSSIDFKPNSEKIQDVSQLLLLTVRPVSKRRRAKTSQVEEWRLNGELPRPLGEPTKNILAANYHPDGKSYVARVGGGLSFVGDWENNLIPLYAIEQSIRHIEFSPDGDKIITSQDDVYVSEWEGENCKDMYKKCEARDEERDKCTREDDGSFRNPFPCEKAIEYDEPCENAIEMCREGREKHKGLGGTMTMATFSHGGNEIAAASSLGSVSLVTSDTYRTYLEFKKPNGDHSPVNSIAFHPKDDYLLAASQNGEVRIWHKKGTGETYTLKIDGESMNSARFDKEGERIITASTNGTVGTVRIWNYKWKKLLEQLRNSTRVCLSTKQREIYLFDEPPEACEKYEACMRSKNKEPENCTE